MWKESLDLRHQEKMIVRKGLLTDRHMTAANLLLSKQFPHLQGLQNTILSQTQFSPIQESGGFIAEGIYKAPAYYILTLNLYPNLNLVLYTVRIIMTNSFISAIQIFYVEERGHWVATSYQNQVVKVFDSATTGRLVPSLERQLVEFYKIAIKDNMLMVSLIPMQQQTNSVYIVGYITLQLRIMQLWVKA